MRRIVFTMACPIKNGKLDFSIPPATPEDPMAPYKPGPEDVFPVPESTGTILGTSPLKNQYPNERDLFIVRLDKDGRTVHVPSRFFTDIQ